MVGVGEGGGDWCGAEGVAQFFASGGSSRVSRLSILSLLLMEALNARSSRGGGFDEWCDSLFGTKARLCT